MLLKVGAALPDPPFELMTNDGPAGFDITLMQHVAAKLGREWQLVPYRGADFNGIFAGLNDGRHPQVRSIDDLNGLVIGVQKGNTSEPVAEKLVAEHRASRVRVYAYDEIETALNDLSTGGCDAFMKLAPVTAWFVRDRPKLKIVQTGITRELLGICVRKGNTALAKAIGKAQMVLVADGTIPALIKKWLGASASTAG
jgi:ABC-type amino acid transport substrate-binding protein